MPTIRWAPGRKRGTVSITSAISCAVVPRGANVVWLGGLVNMLCDWDLTFDFGFHAELHWILEQRLLAITETRLTYLEGHKSWTKLPWGWLQIIRYFDSGAPWFQFVGFTLRRSHKQGYTIFLSELWRENWYKDWNKFKCFNSQYSLLLIYIHPSVVRARKPSFLSL